ncbi:aminotransferase class I/II-fold pyridoxal phosphate-dependent enzyme [Apibacter sp. HY039]|uniref:aminotransferase class I/II-fold pyridoxal phosphate-dependent enzyme n=1 Tax=Apibacter sp. HY039 TaxID=2501476 RepID=UPI000FEBDCFB|nr:aminotransferase class I/II-fold pyridoxal phosphate-dependent enzyme [Apibacter sp. HY039]
MYSEDNQSYSASELELINKKKTSQKEKNVCSSKSFENIINGKTILNFCSSNYLGLDYTYQSSDTFDTFYSAKRYRLSTTPFMNEIRSLTKQLEIKISKFLNQESTLLFTTFQDAYGGIFDSLFTEKDIIFYDEQCHYTLIDCIKSGNSIFFSYKNNDINDLNHQLKKAKLSDYKNIFIVTDGVFSLDGTIADLKNICYVAEKSGAVILLNDSHATGVLGTTGRGTYEYYQIKNQADLIVSSLGNISGKNLGHFVSGKKDIIDQIKHRYKSQKTLNSFSFPVIDAQDKIINILIQNQDLSINLSNNIKYFRKKITDLGFDTLESESSIIPVMLYDAKLAQDFADNLLNRGVWSTSFFYPVVPTGKARVRLKISSAHSLDNLDKAINAIKETGNELGII